MSHRCSLGCLLAVLCAARCCAADGGADFRVADGFEVARFADDSLAHDIFSLTIDARGRVVVSGPGYVKVLCDDDRDGQADRAVLFSASPASGAQGMCFDGNDLIYTGDNALARLRDTDGDGVADGQPETWASLRTAEHGAHAIVLGPDGCFYVVCGNDAGVGPQHATAARSPIKKPRAGAILRWARDGRRSEVLADGFRNPYDIALNEAGHLFTVDSDGERDHHLPWYAPTRLFDVGQGRQHGWVENGWQKSWSQPESFFDNVRRAAVLGRGSPTGLIAYQHRQFPERYRGGLFSACWTLGRIYFLPLQRQGSTYVSRPEIFMETIGDVGFAPVDLAVGPAGELYIAIGGRRTRGSVFCVRFRDAPAAQSAADPLLAVLDADEPLASWSRARWVPLAKDLGREAFEKAAADAALAASRRVRAVEVLTELFGGVSIDVARQALRARDASVSARTAWSLGCGPPDPSAQQLLAEVTYDDDPAVARAAWEALARSEAIRADLPRPPAWLAALDCADRELHAAMLVAARGPGRESFLAQWASRPQPRSPRQRLGRLWVEGFPSAASQEFGAALETCVDAFVSCPDPAVRLEALRLVQIGLGDVLFSRAGPDTPPGYVARHTEQVPPPLRRAVGEKLAGFFPTAEAEVDRELGRTLAMLAPTVPQLLDAIATRCSASSLPVDDLHYLFVLARLPGTRTSAATAATARTLVALHGKLEARGEFPSRNWPLRVGELFEQLSRLDPALPQAVAAEPGFGRAEHSLFVAGMPVAQRPVAARRLLAAAVARDGDDDADDGGEWTSELIAALAVLPRDELLPALRAKWDDFALRDAIALVLARDPRIEDRGRLVDALAALDDDVTIRIAEALASLPADATAHDYTEALRALRRACEVGPMASDQRSGNEAGTRAARFPEHQPVREALVRLLHHWSGETLSVEEATADDLHAAYQPWLDWFRGRFPAQAEVTAGPMAADAATWPQRLASIDWPQGDSAAGKGVFEKQSCHRCHRGKERGGNDRLGPDLTGVTARYTRDDLFATIVDPSRTVAPLYRTMLVTTRSGKVYHGLIVYESPDGTLLQTGADTTVRVTGEALRDMRPSELSLMPTGLLDGLSDRQLADLYAYLKTLSRAQE